MNSPLELSRTGLMALLLLLGSTSCRRASPPSHAVPGEDVLARVGLQTIRQADLNLLLEEKHAGQSQAQARAQALQELVRRAQHAQAALDAGLDHDPVVRAELARVLAARLREQQLDPRIRAIGQIPEAVLRQRYQAELARFQSPEKREVAVLWLDPGPDPARREAYVAKLETARAWFFEESEMAQHPEQGFGVLSIDHSEHAASRFKNGVVGWMQSAGGMDAWQKAVAEIAFSLEGVGTVSPVISRPEGVFLVRVMALQPEARAAFEEVASLLQKEERDRLRRKLETEFDQGVTAGHAVQWIATNRPL